VGRHDCGKIVCRLLWVAALVVLLVGALAGMKDGYFAVPSDSRSHRGDDRTLPFRMPPESRYNFPYDAPLALSPDSARYLHLDLRRLAGPGLQAAVCPRAPLLRSVLGSTGGVDSPMTCEVSRNGYKWERG
jgi:hypothetical protein